MRKFLVVVDSTPECMSALRYAVRRAAATKGGVTMLFVIDADEFQHWIGVADIMRRERREEAEARLAALAEEVQALAGVMPEFAIREGDEVQAVLDVLAEDPDLRVLVLGADPARENPGPLVSALVGKRAGRLPVPVTVVPGALSLEQVDEIA